MRCDERAGGGLVLRVVVEGRACGKHFGDKRGHGRVARILLAIKASGCEGHSEFVEKDYHKIGKLRLGRGEGH